MLNWCRDSLDHTSLLLLHRMTLRSERVVLAGVENWVTTANPPYYLSTEKIIVYLEKPTHAIDRETAEKRIRSFGETTIMTARIALGIWFLERQNPALVQSNGTVAIRPEDILAWRGIAKHSRAVYPGSEARVTDGYERKYYTQVHQDFLYLQDCYMYSEQGFPLDFDGPYAHVTVIRGQRTAWSKSKEPLAYLFAPGGGSLRRPGRLTLSLASLSNGYLNSVPIGINMRCASRSIS